LLEADAVYIVAAGGGLTDNEAAMALLAKSSIIPVFLHIGADAAWKRIEETAAKDGVLPPFLRTENPQETHRVLHERRNAACKKAAGIIVDAEGKSPKELAAEIVIYSKFTVNEADKIPINLL
jgi:shikimate kinase